jgi:hypothetical protein
VPLDHRRNTVGTKNFLGNCLRRGNRNVQAVPHVLSSEMKMSCSHVKMVESMEKLKARQEPVQIE